MGMGNGEWGMGNGEWGKDTTPLPIPYSPLGGLPFAYPQPIMPVTPDHQK